MEPVRWTRLLILPSLVSLASFTSPALYLPDEMLWNCWREMLRLERLMDTAESVKS